MNVKEYNIEEFLQVSRQELLIDVRSPFEFSKGHIPSAINLPLFSDSERSEVGTLYKKTGKKEAVLKGLEFVQPKLRYFVETVFSLLKDHSKSQVFTYCQRGGARSESISWLFNTSGIKTGRLRSGYKSYRNFVLQTLKNPYRFIILGGKTGCGKTDILKEMELLGEQVIDLEGIACHKGSAFGDLAYKKQPTPQQFENLIADKLSDFDCKKAVWIENESPGIGSLFIPFELRRTMDSAPVIDIEIPHGERLSRIEKEYGCYPVPEIIKRLEKIRKKLEQTSFDQAVKYIKNSQVKDAVEILINYYDKGYSHYAQKKQSGKTVYRMNITNDRPKENAKLLIHEAAIKSLK